MSASFLLGVNQRRCLVTSDSYTIPTPSPTCAMINIPHTLHHRLQHHDQGCNVNIRIPVLRSPLTRSITHQGSVGTRTGEVCTPHRTCVREAILTDGFLRLHCSRLPPFFRSKLGLFNVLRPSLGVRGLFEDT